MSQCFIELSIFLKNGKSLERTSIRIDKPIRFGENLMSCKVSFLGSEKYDAIIKGADEFNAVESALSYVRAICSNSEDPEFFISESESMKGFHKESGWM